MRRIIPLSLLAGVLACPIASATEAPNVELGRTLFHATSLGTNGKSCASCHPDGKGLEEIEAYDPPTLREMINFCIRDALKGAMLAADSQELQAMERYLRSLHGK